MNTSEPLIRRGQNARKWDVCHSVDCGARLRPHVSDGPFGRLIEGFIVTVANWARDYEPVSMDHRQRVFELSLPTYGHCAVARR